MFVCPLCENAQASGEACDVCGKVFAPAPDAQEGAPPLEGLEPTLQADAFADAPQLEGLEPTLLAPAPAVDGLPGEADWVERTVLDLAIEVAPVPIELEPTRHTPAADAPRDPFALAVCRYCRTAAAPGDLFCSRCGMKLDIYRPAVRPPQED